MTTSVVGICLMVILTLAAVAIVLGSSNEAVADIAVYEQRLPGLTTYDIATNWCQGSEDACAENNFSSTSLFGSDTVHYSYSGGCPGFDIPTHGVVFYERVPTTTQWSRFEAGPMSFVELCEAQFMHIVGFLCTRDGNSRQCYTQPIPHTAD